MPKRACIECRRRPPVGRRRRCATCQLRREPIGTQVEESRRRLAMVPEPLRQKRSKALTALAPEGTAWCAGCQSFRDHEDFAKGATRCRACASAAQHGAMIERTYGLSAEQYDALLQRQGGKCAICRARPVSKRLAVDHDHDSGAVRGLLCSRCNHDLLGSAWDSIALATALLRYLLTPPAGGQWLAPEVAPPFVSSPSEVAEAGIVAKRAGLELVTASSAPVEKRLDQMTKPELRALQSAADAACSREHFLPIGSIAMPGTSSAWLVWRGTTTPPDDVPEGVEGWPF